MSNHLEQPDGMPWALFEVLRTAMALEPTQRYSSGSAFAAAARAALVADDDATVMRPTTAAVPVLDTPAAASAAAGAGPGPTHEGGPDVTGSGVGDDGGPVESAAEAAVSTNSRKVALVAAACLLLLVGGLIALLGGSGDVRTVDKAGEEGSGGKGTTSIDTNPTVTVESAATDTIAGPGDSVQPPTDTVVPPPTDTVVPPPTDTVVPPPTDTVVPPPGGAPVVATSSPPPVTGPGPTSPPATLPPAVPTACSITDASARLDPGITWGVVSAQNAEMVAPLSCTLTRGGVLTGSMKLNATFTALGFTGGHAKGTSSIAWNDGATTQLTADVDVAPGSTGTTAPFEVVLSLRFFSGIGAPGSGTTTRLPAAATFDPVSNVVKSITGMSGMFPWNR